MPGPAPKASPARRNSRVGTVRLPPEGRQGPAPAWPLSGRQKVSEARLWLDLWATPQAAAWERLGPGVVRVVARYCRLLIVAEHIDKDALAEVRQLEDRLGLTPKAMRMLLWEIAADEVAEQRQESTSARGRIKAV